MKVQIFIPTFNRAAKLERVIRSVLNQTYPNVEVVVLDNHSTDDTPKLVASLMASDSRVKHVRHDKNLGMIANFNAVQGLVDSEYFSMFTDDDEYEPWFVETALKCFEKNKEIQFVACNAPTKLHGEIIKSQLESLIHMSTSASRLNCSRIPSTRSHAFRRIIAVPRTGQPQRAKRNFSKNQLPSRRSSLKRGA